MIWRSIITSIYISTCITNSIIYVTTNGGIDYKSITTTINNITYSSIILNNDASIIIPNTLYAYDNTYVDSTDINANKGYWIKCTNSGTIKLQQN